MGGSKALGLIEIDNQCFIVNCTLLHIVWETGLFTKTYSVSSKEASCAGMGAQGGGLTSTFVILVSWAAAPKRSKGLCVKF